MKDKSWFTEWLLTYSVVIICFMALGFSIIYGSEKIKKDKEFICLSFANYCLEVHVLEPTHEDYLLFLKQEKQFPNYYQKHIIEAQKEYNERNKK